MKVLLVNSPFGGGGVTTYATQLVSCLSADTELTVVLGDDRKAPITDPRVKVIYHDTKSVTIKEALYFINLINNVIKPDVVIISMAFVMPVIVPYLNDDIKVISISHSGKYFSSDYSAINHKYIDRIVAASSDYNKKYLEKKFHIKDKNKIKVIYNFVADDKELESLRFNKKDQKPISLVYAGGSSIGKAPHLMSKIVTALLNTDLDFLFYWTGRTTIPLTTTIFKHSKIKTVQQIMPEDKRLVFLGRIPDKHEFDLLLGRANIMMAPSINEGCSMALLEGHRAGSIFIVADYENSNSEIVRNGKSGFVIAHDDIDGFVKTIRTIINNHSSYYQLYENSHNTFKTELSYDVWKRRIFDVFNGEFSHKKRKKKVSNIGLWLGTRRMIWLHKMSLLRRFVQLSLPSYMSFHQQYRNFKKRQKQNKND